MPLTSSVLVVVLALTASCSAQAVLPTPTDLSLPGCFATTACGKRKVVVSVPLDPRFINGEKVAVFACECKDGKKLVVTELGALVIELNPGNSEPPAAPPATDLFPGLNSPPPPKAKKPKPPPPALDPFLPIFAQPPSPSVKPPKAPPPPRRPRPPPPLLLEGPPPFVFLPVEIPPAFAPVVEFPPRVEPVIPPPVDGLAAGEESIVPVEDMAPVPGPEAVTQTSASDTGSDDSSVSTGVIVGAAVGGVAVLAAVAALAMFLVRRNKNKDTTAAAAAPAPSKSSRRAAAYDIEQGGTTSGTARYTGPPSPTIPGGSFKPGVWAPQPLPPLPPIEPPVVAAPRVVAAAEVASVAAPAPVVQPAPVAPVAGPVLKKQFTLGSGLKLQQM